MMYGTSLCACRTKRRASRSSSRASSGVCLEGLSARDHASRNPCPSGSCSSGGKCPSPCSMARLAALHRRQARHAGSHSGTSNDLRLVFLLKMRFCSGKSTRPLGRIRTQSLEGSAEVSPGTAQSSPSYSLRVLHQTSDLSEWLRQERRKKRWTQARLAEFCAVRTQTVSSWESGKRPQRRFFAKIAEFLELPDEASVEALLDGNSTDPAAALRPRPSLPSQLTDLQTDVVKTVIHQLGQNRAPSPDLVRLLDNLLVSVGLPAGSVAVDRTRGDRHDHLLANWHPRALRQMASGPAISPDRRVLPRRVKADLWLRSLRHVSNGRPGNAGQGGDALEGRQAVGRVVDHGGDHQLVGLGGVEQVGDAALDGLR
jgi:transcriptional regulator with XRE-family HTH domain